MLSPRHLRTSPKLWRGRVRKTPSARGWQSRRSQPRTLARDAEHKRQAGIESCSPRAGSKAGLNATFSLAAHLPCKTMTVMSRVASNSNSGMSISMRMPPSRRTFPSRVSWQWKQAPSRRTDRLPAQHHTRRLAAGILLPRASPCQGQLCNPHPGYRRTPHRSSNDKLLFHQQPASTASE